MASTMAAARALGTATPTSMTASRRARPSHCRRRSGSIADERNQGVGEVLRGGVPLQQFRHDFLAENEIGEPDRVRLHQGAGDQLLEQREPGRR